MPRCPGAMEGTGAKAAALGCLQQVGGAPPQGGLGGWCCHCAGGQHGRGGASWLEMLTPASPPPQCPHQPPTAPFTPLSTPNPTAPASICPPPKSPDPFHPPSASPVPVGGSAPAAPGWLCSCRGAASPPAPRLGCITPMAGVPRARGRGGVGRTPNTHSGSAAAAWPPAPQKAVRMCGESVGHGLEHVQGGPSRLVVGSDRVSGRPWGWRGVRKQETQ